MIFAHGAEIGQLKTHLSEIQGICVKTASHRNKERARRSSLTSKARGEICSTRTGRELPGRLSPYLAAIPTCVVTHSLPAFLGCAAMLA